MKLSAIVFLLPSLALATAKQPAPKSLEALDKKVSAQAEQIRKLRIENSILKKSLGVNEPPSQKARQVDDAIAFSEKAIFTKFVESYREGKKDEYKRALRLLSKNYPKSRYFPEIYYMTAQSALAKKKFKTALKAYNTILKRFPKSDRTAAAIFGKGLTYKELNVKKQAIALFEDVQRRFPNSPEAYRASLQLKLLAKKDKN